MSMIFPINAKRNTENARNYWTTTRRESRRGYDIEYLCEHKTNGAQSRIILSVYNGKNPFYIAELETPESSLVFKLSEYRNINEPHGSTICIDNVDIYARGSNYKRRTERSMRYLQKYGSMACLVHGLIAAGLVESTEAPTEPETIEGKEDTTSAETEPQEGTETAQKATDMATFCAAYRAAYTALYDHCGEPETDEKERYYSALFDQETEEIADAVRRFCAYRGDLVTSDREAAAFMIALEAVGAPTTPETVTDGETTTSTEKEPQSATETAQREPETVTGYIVQCRASRNQWTDYTGAYQNRAAAEKAKACAESRHTCDRYGKEIMYRIAEVQKRPEDVMNDSGHYKTGETVTHNGIIYTQYSNAPAFTPYLWESRTESGEIIVRLARTLDECIEETTQRATESAEKTADDTTPTAGDTTPTETTQEGAQTDGTSEGGNTTTPPHNEPPRAAERATDAAAGSVSQSDRRTRPAAPQSHESGEGIQRHHRPQKTAYRAIQRAAPFPRRRVTTSSPDRRKVTFSAWMYKTGSDPPKI